MNCEIDIDIEGEAPICFTRKDRKASKEHTCYECEKTIQSGEIYRYESGVWEDGVNSFKTCHDCISVRNAFTCSYVYGTLWDEMKQLIVEYDGQLSEKKLNALTPQAKTKVLQLIDDLIEEDA